MAASPANRWWFILVVVGSVLIAQGLAQPAAAQFKQIFDAVQQALEGQQAQPVSRDGGIILEENRELRNKLEIIRKRLEGKHYVEVAQNLGLLLEDPQTKDFFLSPQGNQRSRQSFQTELRSLIGSLPKEGREAYEAQFGAKARRMLAAAIAQGDLGAVQDVARRYTHTAAGYDGLYLLGAEHLDHGRPREAAVCLMRLLQSPTGGAQYEPHLSVLIAACWRAAGEPEAARVTLLDVKRRYPKAVFKAPRTGQRVEMFSDDAAALDWLASVVPPQSAGRPALPEAWATHRGGPDRNAPTGGNVPFLAPRWQREIADPTYWRGLEEERERIAARKATPLPAFHSLAVGELVLMRTPRGLRALDVQSGAVKWEYPSPAQDNIEAGFDTQLWRDVAFGTASADAEQAYLVEDYEPVPESSSSQNPYSMGMGMRRIRRGAFRPWMGPAVWGGESMSIYSPITSNTLTAITLSRQGALRWYVGGADGGYEPQLAGAYFLGPPLPYGERLYALAEINSSLRLVTLDPRTGKLQWWVEMAAVEQPIDQDPFRRMAGAVPSIAEGVIVCPTSCGGVVAVDMATQALLWAYQYPRAPESRNQPDQGMYAQLQQGNRWTDPSATISAGRVLITPLEAQEIYCLDLLTGREQWRAPRGRHLYLACVSQGKVVLVGDRQVTALKLADGKAAWATPVALPGGSPTGRGVYAGERYYLPLSNAAVLEIDLASGKITHQVRNLRGIPAGNLIWHRGTFVSQGSHFIAAFDEQDALARHLAEALARNPADNRAQLRQAELELSNDKTAAAIERLRGVYRADGSPRSRALLVSALLEGVARKLPGFEAMQRELDDLAHP